MKVRWLGGTYDLGVAEYRAGGIALLLRDPVLGTFVKCTVWVPGLAPEEVAVKDYSENEGVLAALLAAGAVSEPHRWVTSGFVRLPVCRLTDLAISTVEEGGSA